MSLISPFFSEYNSFDCAFSLRISKRLGLAGPTTSERQLCVLCVCVRACMRAYIVCALCRCAFQHVRSWCLDSISLNQPSVCFFYHISM